MSPALAFSLMTVLVGALLVLERRPDASRTLSAITKGAASAVFVAFGAWTVRDSGIEGHAGVFLVAALVLSFCGDLLLIPKSNKRLFLAGVVAFLLAHIAYFPAFLGRGADVRVIAAGAVVTALPAFLVLRWLRPHVQGTMWRAVVAYVVVISLMLCTAAGTVARALLAGAASPGPSLFVGALCFWLSDLTVARERFVVHAFLHRAIGLPLYFFGQLLIVSGWR